MMMNNMMNLCIWLFRNCNYQILTHRCTCKVGFVEIVAKHHLNFYIQKNYKNIVACRQAATEADAIESGS